MSQRGFIQLPMMAWGAIAAGAVILSLTGALYIQNVRLGGCQADLRAANAALAVLGAQIEAQNAAVGLLEAEGKRRAAEAATASLQARQRNVGLQGQVGVLAKALEAAKTNPGGPKPSACPAGDAAKEVRRALAGR